MTKTLLLVIIQRQDLWKKHVKWLRDNDIVCNNSKTKVICMGEFPKDTKLEVDYSFIHSFIRFIPSCDTHVIKNNKQQSL